MRVVFAGTPEVALPSLAHIADSHHELLAVITRPDSSAGRGRKVRPSAASTWAATHDVDVLSPAKPNEEEFLDELRQLRPDCVAVVAYGALVPQVALEIPTYGWINLHFSLLPAWRGAAPVQHAIWRGDEITGASVFQLEPGLDTGPVFGSVTETIQPTDTSGNLLERLSGSGARLLVEVLDALESGRARADEQPLQGVSTAPKITTDDARIRWQEPAFGVERRVRAMTPSPGAWTTWNGERVRLGPLTPDPGGPRLSSGTVECDKNAVYVGTGTHPVSLGDIQPPGKKRMPATAWARGLHATDSIVFS